MSIWTTDWISGGTPASRNRRREKTCDALIDIGKFLITGVVFGSVLQLGDEARVISTTLKWVVGAGIVGGAVVVWIGVRQLSHLEEE